MDKKVIGRVATLALGKNDQEDQDAEKTANPYTAYCQMMAQQQMDDMDETIEEDELKEYQPEGVFVRGH